MPPKVEYAIPRAFYHLRTLMEHHMKAALKKPIEEPIVGDVLCGEYAKFDPFLAGRSSLTPLYAEASAKLHRHEGTLQEFEKLKAALDAHFGLLVALQRTKTAGGGL